ncbi:lipopolysaccharide biosynthesis protein [Aliivibrio fischeri]|uniref:lipopolysaccharide biosynthesis protein n=1 Tax=Aliivibrio fischeri TaxID=668 RepID=UPI0012D9EDB2|nr:lipopolysaccharide biosynthesis protein [Aliivibrio fischeri]
MSKINKGFKWSAIERICTQVAQFVIMLILARLLGPHAYGLIGMITVVIAVSQTLVDSGFSLALIRKKEIKDECFDTAFIVNLCMSLFIYTCIFFLSDYVSLYFNEPELTNILKVMGLVIIINSLTLIHKTKLTIELNFKTQSKITILSVLLSGFFSILLANINPSVWVLVFYTICNSVISCFLYYKYVRWIPNFIFSKKEYVSLISFSYKLVIASVLNVVFDNIYNFIIGRYYSTIELGFFSQAKTLSVVPTNTFSSIVQRVTYRHFSEIKDNKENLKNFFISVIKNTSLVFLPLMILLSAYSSLVIEITLGSEWERTSDILKVLALAYSLYPLHAINLNILNVFGRSDLFLKLEIVKKILMILILFFTINHGILGITIGMLVFSFISTYINAIYTYQYINLTMIEQALIVCPIYVVILFSAYTPVIFLSRDIGMEASLILSILSILSIYTIFFRENILNMFHGIKNE